MDLLLLYVGFDLLLELHLGLLDVEPLGGLLMVIHFILRFVKLNSNFKIQTS